MLSQYRTWTWSRYRITNNRYQSANMTASLSCQRDADMSVTDAAARVRRGVASGVTLSQCRTWTRSRYQITNNCYQSANVTLGLSCQRDADTHITDMAARVRRCGCAGSGVMLSQCRTRTRSRYRNTNNRYQSANVTLGLSCQLDANTHVTDTAARVRGEWRHAEMRSCTNMEPLSNHERDAGTYVAAWVRHEHHGHRHGGASAPVADIVPAQFFTFHAKCRK